MSLEDKRFSRNPVYQEAERLLLKLHELIRAGQGDGPEADAVRDSLDAPWEQLLPEEAARLDGLSGDLYMLMGEETFVEVSDEQRQQLPARLRDAFYARRYEEMLELLRWNPSFLPREGVAYIRARTWMALEHFAPAAEFFDYASELNPANPSYPALALAALLRAGRTEEAERRAARYVKDEAAHPRLLFYASYALFSAARRSDGRQARMLYEDVVRAVRTGLKHEAVFQEAGTLPSVVLSGRMNLALALFHLGRRDEARRELETTTQRHGKSAEAWTLRGIFELQVNPAAAAGCFERAIQQGARHVWAYYGLARIRLQEAAYPSCIELCQAGIERTNRPELIATMLEWIAIAMTLNHASRESVKQAFQMALEFDPLNPRLRENVARFERLEETFEISPELEPDEILREFVGGAPVISMSGLAMTG